MRSVIRRGERSWSGFGPAQLAVGEIAGELPVSRPAVSQHLRVLREAGLVSERKEGTRRIYRLQPAGLIDLRAYLNSFWTVALADFKATAEREQGGAG